MTTTIGRTVLLCRDLDASAAFWAAGADAESGDRFAHVDDPDGHRIVVVQLGPVVDPA